MSRTSSPIALAALYLLLGWLAFGPALRGGWLWDDDISVSANPRVRDPGGLEAIWLGRGSPDYFPLTTSVEWVEWRLWQDRPEGYRWVNLALHAAGALLLWQLLRKLDVGCAWLGGAVFLIHPLAVESVCWISELKNVLSLPLALAAAAAYVDGDRTGNPRFKAMAWLFFLGAMLAKSSVVMLPFAFLLYGWWQRGRIGRKDLLATAPCFAVSALLGLVTWWFQEHRAMLPPDLPLGGIGERVTGMGLSGAFYLAKSLCPVALLPMYPRWPLAPSLARLLPWPALAALCAWLWSRRNSRGGLVLGAGWFFLPLIPVSGLVVLSYFQVAWTADHFAYLSLTAVGGLAAAAVSAARARLPSDAKYALGAVAALIAFGLIAEDRSYAGNFRSQESLWSYTLERNPTAWLAENNLGFVLLQEGQAAEATAHYEAALRINPRSALAHYSLGNVLAQRGRLQAAIAQYEEAVRLQPGYLPARDNLGNALCRAGRFDEGVAQFREAIRRRPDYAMAHANLGVALARAGRSAPGLQELEAAVRLEPEAAELRVDYGNALYLSGDKGAATEQYRRAMALDPRNADARRNLTAIGGR